MTFKFKPKQAWIKALIFSLCCLVLGIGVACGPDSVFTSNAPLTSTNPTFSEVPAGSVQLQFTGSAPSQVSVGSVDFVPLPVAGSTVFVAPLQSATTPVSLTAIEQAGATSVRYSSPALTSGSGTQLIYQGDPTSVTFDDFVLVFTLTTLPPNLRTPANIATQANTLFSAGNFTAAALDPVPNSVNTDYVAGGTVPAPDLLDAAVVYAATFLPANQRTAATLANTVNVLLPGAGLVASDIVAIPGVDLPGGVRVEPPVSAPAGSFQISVQAETLATQGFQISGTEFVQLPVQLFPGFVSFAAEPGSSLIQVDFNQVQIEGVAPDACVVVHVPGQDPRIADTQLASAAACEGVTLAQVDRMGIPGFVTVFIPPNPLEPQMPVPSLEDTFNRAEPVNDVQDFRDDVVDSLTILFSLNDESGDDPSDDAAAIQGLADALVPDILPFNLNAPSGFASLNGRNLEDDVIDIALGLLSEGACTSDLVEGDSVFRDEFPFFGVPN